MVWRKESNRHSLSRHGIKNKIITKSIPYMYRVKVGKTYWFEYHCWENEQSSDAEMWHHSHQKATVVKMLYEGGDGNEKDRQNDGNSASFLVKFDDGYTHSAFEDELMESKNGFYCDEPPKVK